MTIRLRPLAPTSSIIASRFFDDRRRSMDEAD